MWNMKTENTKWYLVWKKVNQKELEENLKSLEIGDDGGWGELKDILENLPKRKNGRKENDWWTKRLEQMAKDTRRLRRENDTGWKLARKVFRNMMINKRYENMKTKLGDMKDPEIFKAIKQLEGKRAIPQIRKEDNTKAFEQDEISDLIAK